MSRTRLEEEFIADHQQLTKAFQKLIDSVERNEPVDFQRDADHLDHVAGPHIEFKEHVLYPRIEGDLGHEFRAKLLREHQVVRSALTFLEQRPAEPLNADEQARVQEQLRIGLDHVVACGSLLSYLTVLDETEQDDMLRSLKECRDKHLQWTQLSGAAGTGTCSTASETEGTTTNTHLAMHQDHRLWQSNLECARADIEEWKSEFDMARTLTEIGLRKHLKALEQCEDAFNEIEEEITAHEHFLAERERTGHHDPSPSEQPMTKTHCQQIANVQKMCSEHETFKRRHHAIIAHLAALNSVLDIQVEQ